MGYGDEQIRYQWGTQYRRKDAKDLGYDYAYLKGSMCHPWHYAMCQMLREIQAEYTMPGGPPPFILIFGWSMGGNGMWNAACFDNNLFNAMTSIGGYGNGTRINLLDVESVERFSLWCSRVFLRAADCGCMQTAIHALDNCSFFGDAVWMNEWMINFQQSTHRRLTHHLKEVQAYLKKWPKGSNHHQTLETALFGIHSGVLVMDRIFEYMANSTLSWPVSRSVAPEGWDFPMP